MAGINYARVLVGGLVAGVVANACDLVINMFLMADDMTQMAQRLGLNQDLLNSPTVAISWIVVDFIWATLIVWTYASIRPRFGPGPKTAIIAGFIPFAAVTMILYGFAQMGIFTMPVFIKGTLLSAVTTSVTSLVGGWMYRES